MHDIIKGMLFIHSSEIKCHGNLTSANCVVDSRFTLKITDFGVPLLQSTSYESEDIFYKSNSFDQHKFLSNLKYLKVYLKLKEQLWKAPELQTSFSSMNSYPSTNMFIAGTQKGDVYSFAIIIQEILYRQGVFYLTDEDQDHIFRKYDQTNESSSLIEPTKLTYKGFSFK